MSQQTYIYRWDRHGRKGQCCLVLARGAMNACLVKFEDGYTMVTSRNALKLATDDALPAAGKINNGTIPLRPVDNPWKNWGAFDDRADRSPLISDRSPRAPDEVQATEGGATGGGK